MRFLFLLKCLLIILLANLQIVFAQDSGKLKREVLFTLGTNEIIEYREYFVRTALKGYEFTAVVYDTEKKEETFIFNGKRIVSVEGRSISVETVDPTRENSYVLKTRGKSYLHSIGKTVFDLHLNGNSYSYCDNDGKDERVKSKVYVVIDGKMEGSFDEVRLYKDGYGYKLAGRWYLKIDDKITGPYADVSYDPIFTESGKYTFSYKKDNGWYVNINGSIFGPYADAYDPIFTESGKYAFSYKKDNGWYVNINGKIFGSYADVSSNLILTENGKYAFSYKKDNGWYVNINGNIFGPYLNLDHDMVLAENGDYGFEYIESDDNVWKSEGTLQSYRYSFPFKISDLNEIFTEDGQHSFFSDWDYEYVVIDGQAVGKSPAIKAWYNEKNRSFIWNSIEGKELVVYEYRL